MNDNYDLPTKFVFHPVHTENYCLFDMKDVSPDGYVAIYEYDMRAGTTRGVKRQNYWTESRIVRLLESEEWTIDIVLEDESAPPELEDLL